MSCRWAFRGNKILRFWPRKLYLKIQPQRYKNHQHNDQYQYGSHHLCWRWFIPIVVNTCLVHYYSCLDQSSFPFRWWPGLGWAGVSTNIIWQIQGISVIQIQTKKQIQIQIQIQIQKHTNTQTHIGFTTRSRR